VAKPNLTGAGVRLPWAREQLRIALEILDNPGGGLVFGYQAIGQVRAHLEETDAERWEPVIRLLHDAEQHAVRRDFGPAQEKIREALRQLEG